MKRIYYTVTRDDGTEINIDGALLVGGSIYIDGFIGCEVTQDEKTRFIVEIMEKMNGLG